MSQCKTAQRPRLFGTYSNHADNDNNYYGGAAGGGYMTTGSPYGSTGGSPGGFARVCGSFLPL